MTDGKVNFLQANQLISSNENNKFVDLEGLRVFWANAKSYIDAVNVTLTEENVDGQLVKLEITPNEAGREFTLKLDEKALSQKLSALEGAISGGTFFRGVFEDKKDVESPKNGDVIAVGNKEYIYHAASTAEDKWIELGDTTAELQRISDLEGAVDDIKAEIGVDGNDETATGLYLKIRQMEEGIRQDFGAADGEILEKIGEFSTEDEDATGICLEIEERDAATLASANAYTDAAIEAVKGEIGIDGYYTKEEVDAKLKANSEADQAYTDEVVGEFSKTEGDTTTPATGLCKEIEERDAATLEAANNHANDVAATAEANAKAYADSIKLEINVASKDDIDGLFA